MSDAVERARKRIGQVSESCGPACYVPDVARIARLTLNCLEALDRLPLEALLTGIDFIRLKEAKRKFEEAIGE